MAIKGAIVVDIELCKGCGVCVEACPQDVIKLSKKVNGKGYSPDLITSHDKALIFIHSCTFIPIKIGIPVLFERKIS